MKSSSRVTAGALQAARARPRVVIAVTYITDYRVPFFERLRESLREQGVELQLLYGKPSASEARKNVAAPIDWAVAVPTRYLFKERICWLPLGGFARDADLVIVPQENKLLYNLWLLTFGRPRRLAFWGHGRNMQSSNRESLRERFKRWTANKVDWWFAYTSMSAALIADSGFPGGQTTVVENAVDTQELDEECARVTPAQCDAMRRRFGLQHGPVGLYLGSIERMKRLDLLIAAAIRIRARIPDFQLLVAGKGSEQAMIEAAAREHNWIRYAGPLRGKDKATALILSDVMLNPGAVGLGILDSFVSGTPLVTTDCDTHGPEISYLDSGRNGIMTAEDDAAYADAVIAMLSDGLLLARLGREARTSGQTYSIENMAERFSHGILNCLALAPAAG
jgi:glycosyltransferase involved in cell wall biosynthesis